MAANGRTVCESGGEVEIWHVKFTSSGLSDAVVRDRRLYNAYA